MERDAVDQSGKDLRRAHRQGPYHPQSPVCRQCRVGLVVDAEFGIRRRARVQDNSAAWISRSQISVNSLMWRRVRAMSSADAGFVGSRATSETPRSKPPASASASRARRARSGSARPCSFPNIPSMKRHGALITVEERANLIVTGGLVRGALGLPALIALIRTAARLAGESRSNSAGRRAEPSRKPRRCLRSQR